MCYICFVTIVFSLFKIGCVFSESIDTNNNTLTDVGKFITSSEINSCGIDSGNSIFVVSKFISNNNKPKTTFYKL